jgi:hypothetical protein
VTLTTHPHLVPRSTLITSHISPPLVACMAVARQMYFTLSVAQSITYANRAVLWLRRLVVGLCPRNPSFSPSSVHMGFVADKVALGQIFLRVLRFSFVNIIPPSFSIIIYHPGDEICPLAATVQRCNLSSKSTITCRVE